MCTVTGSDSKMNTMQTQDLLAVRCSRRCRRSSVTAAPQKQVRPGATDTEIKIGKTMPYSGPASAYGTIGKVAGGLLQDGQRRGRHQRPQDQLHHPRRRLQPAEDGRDGAQAGRAGRGAAALFQTLGTPTNTAIHKYVNAQEGAAALRRHRRDQVERPEELPVDHGLAAELPDRGRDLREVHPEEQARTRRSRILYQNDDYGKDYLKGLQGRPRATRREDDRRRGDLRGDRPDGRLADRHAARLRAPTCSSTSRRRSSPRRRSARPTTSAGSRCTILNNVVASVGSVLKPAGLDKSVGLITVQLLQGPDRPAVEERPGDARVARLHEEVLPRRQPDRREQRLRLHRPRRPWCRCSSSAATTSRARTS